MLNDFEMLADPVEFKIAMLNAKEQLEHPDLAPPPRQRPEPRAGDAARRADATACRLRSRLGGAPCDASRAAPCRRRAAPATGNSASAADDLAITLERLAGLRDKGLITRRGVRVEEARAAGADVGGVGPAAAPLPDGLYGAELERQIDEAAAYLRGAARSGVPELAAPDARLRARLRPGRRGRAARS